MSSSFLSGNCCFHKSFENPSDDVNDDDPPANNEQQQQLDLVPASSCCSYHPYPRRNIQNVQLQLNRQLQEQQRLRRLKQYCLHKIRLLLSLDEDQKQRRRRRQLIPLSSCPNFFVISSSTPATSLCLSYSCPIRIHDDDYYFADEIPTVGLNGVSCLLLLLLPCTPGQQQPCSSPFQAGSRG